MLPTYPDYIPARIVCAAAMHALRFPLPVSLPGEAGEVPCLTLPWVVTSGGLVGLGKQGRGGKEDRASTSCVCGSTKDAPLKVDQAMR